MSRGHYILSDLAILSRGHYILSDLAILSRGHYILSDPACLASRLMCSHEGKLVTKSPQNDEMFDFTCTTSRMDVPRSDLIMMCHVDIIYQLLVASCGSC